MYRYNSTAEVKVMAWKFDSETPVYLQIERKICADILSGKYPADSQLPSVRQFALEAAVNPNTVQKALGELESRGIVYSKGTVGRFVTGDKQALEYEHIRVKQRVISDFLKSVQSLGITRREIIDFLNEGEI